MIACNTFCRYFLAASIKFFSNWNILFCPFKNSCRLSRLSSSVSVANALCIRSYPFQDCLCGRHLSYAPIISGMKGGQSSLNERKKQKVRPVWRPISTESDDSTGGLLVSSTSAAEYKSEPEPLKEMRPQAEIIIETLPVLKPNDDSDIVNKTEKHSVSIQVDAPLIRFIKGKWGLTQKQIERETGVKIIFPSTKGDTSIVIEGASVDNVNRASEKITNVLEQAVKSPNLDYSHFVSLPLAIHPELVEKLHNFQKSVLEEVNMTHGDMDGSSSDYSSDEKGDDSKYRKGSNVAVKLEVQNDDENVRLSMDADDPKLKSSTSSAMGIDRSIFIKPQTFHLTVLMLKLWNKDRVAKATKVLQEIFSEVMDALENRPVSVRLRGLACMRGSPAKAKVVYAPIEEVGSDGRLLRACQVIIGAYVEAGLVLQKDALHSLKLHATLMNARHRKREMGTRRNDSFDARGIFKKFGSEDWGEYLIPEAHLSQRFVFDESGYYHCCGSIPFPGSIKTE